jgi:23S rRNA pseudouridine1911/1915/1917 synthase
MLPTIYEFVVAESESGQRLDRYLAARRLPVASRSQVKRLLDQGHCRVNDQICRPAKRLKTDDRVIIAVPPPEPDQALPEAIELAVLYEDEQLIVVDKPPGMVVHPSAGHSSGTLVNALLSHCSGLSGIGGKLRPGIVHRLDKLTSGILVASKTDEAHLSLAEQFARHDVERCYLTVVAGKLTSDGTFDTRHGRHPRDRKRYSGRVERGKRAVTHYRVLALLRGASLVEATLETGRTHQVRVHFAEGGHPVLGDPVYGRPPRDRVARDEASKLGRQALHARVLGFTHPTSGQRLRFASPPPPDMQRLISALELEKTKGEGR